MGATGSLSLPTHLLQEQQLIRDGSNQEITPILSPSRLMKHRGLQLIRTRDPTSNDIFARFYAPDPRYYVGTGVKLAQDSIWVLDGMLQTSQTAAKKTDTSVQSADQKLSRKTRSVRADDQFVPVEYRSSSKLDLLVTHQAQYKNGSRAQVTPRADQRHGFDDQHGFKSHSSAHVIKKSMVERHLARAVDLGVCRGDQKAVQVKVKDPLHFAESSYRFSLVRDHGHNQSAVNLQTVFPETLIIPAASGYSMEVTCDDVALEIACPGIDSPAVDSSDVCFHQLTLKAHARDPSTRRRSKREVSQALKDRIFLHALRKQNAVEKMKARLRRARLSKSGPPSRRTMKELYRLERRSGVGRFARRTDLINKNVYEMIGRSPGYLTR